MVNLLAIYCCIFLLFRRCGLSYFAWSGLLGYAKFSWSYVGVLGWSLGSLWICKSLEGSSGLMWCVWVEHNRHPFEGKELSLRNLKFLFLKTFFNWSSQSSTLSMFSLMEFLDSLCPAVDWLWLFYAMYSFLLAVFFSLYTGMLF